MGCPFVQKGIPVGQTTTGRGEQTRDHPEESGFPGTIGTNQRSQLPLMDFKRKIPKDLEVSVVGIQMFNG
jgi:hypothetical protein